MKNQRYKGAVKEIEWFRKHEQMNYKDVALYMKVISERLSNRVKKFQLEKRLRIMECMTFCVVRNRIKIYW
jgi:hypothetical protein